MSAGSHTHRNLGPVTSGPAALPGRGPRPLGAAVAATYRNFAGAEPARSPVPTAAMTALSRLANTGAPDPADANIGSPGAPMSGMPAGYTYLFQLATHDLLHTDLTARRNMLGGGMEGDAPVNRQIRTLMLDTVLGGGSDMCPMTFDRNGHLRMGQMRADVRKDWQFQCPAHDLPRAAWSADGQPDRKDGLDIVLIPDVRNDDNLVLGQLTGLFRRIFNIIRARISAADPDPELTATLILTRVYRRILRQDLLRRLLNPAILDLYEAGQMPVLDVGGDGRPSAEFAFAAARMGHAMVRDAYAVRQRPDGALEPLTSDTAILTSSQHQPRKLPLQTRYDLDWNLFFATWTDQAPPGFNWAMRMGHMVVSGLRRADAAHTQVPGPTGDVVTGLVFRDVARENSIPLLSAAEIAGSCRNALPLLALHLGHLSSPDAESDLVAQGLADLVAATGATPPAVGDLAALTQAPPLSLTLKCEALLLGDRGARFGPLGSILVAEAMRPLFKPAPWERDNDPLADRERDILGATVTTMHGLLHAVAPHLQS